MSEAHATSEESHKICISYEIVTPDDAETGEASDRGWIDEDGVNIELDGFDIEEGKNIVDETVRYLQREGAILPSDYPGAARWFSTEGCQDSNWITKSYHFVNYSHEELEAIASKMRL